MEADSVVKCPDGPSDTTKKKKHRERRHSSASESPDSQKLDKKECAEKREDWMSLPTSFTSISTQDSNKLKELEKKLQKEQDQYDPRKSSRELNKYWKDGGDGLPKFQKPREGDDRKERSSRYVTDSLKYIFTVILHSTQTQLKQIVTSLKMAKVWPKTSQWRPNTIKLKNLSAGQTHNPKWFKPSSKQTAKSWNNGWQ